MNFSLPKKLEEYIANQVKSGYFNNASEVVRDALREHGIKQQKLEILRAEVQKGLDSADAGRFSPRTMDDIITDAKKRAQQAVSE